MVLLRKLLEKLRQPWSHVTSILILHWTLPPCNLSPASTLSTTPPGTPACPAKLQPLRPGKATMSQTCLFGPLNKELCSCCSDHIVFGLWHMNRCSQACGMACQCLVLWNRCSETPPSCCTKKGDSLILRFFVTRLQSFFQRFNAQRATFGTAAGSLECDPGQETPQ